jgi:saccharopine dehydrogenase-like NADP-dependent oxidoreductase
MIKKKILVVGSNGILGKHIVEKVINSFGVESLVISDYKEQRLKQQISEINKEFGEKPLSRIIDASSKESIETGLENIDFVLIAIQQKEALIQKTCIEIGVNSIDLSVSPDFIDKVLDLNEENENSNLQLITGGLFPGLSGILANDIYKTSKEKEPVDVGLLQSTNGTNGKTGVSDMLLIFDKKVDLLTKEQTTKYSGFSYKKKFEYPKPFNIKTLRLTNFIERDYLRNSGIKANYWTSFDNESFNKLISGLKKIRFLKLFNYPKISSLLSSLITKQNKGEKDEKIGLCAKNSINEISIILTSDYESTASCAIGFAKLIMSNEKEYKGIKLPFEIFLFKEIREHLNDVIIDIKAPNNV